MPRRGGVPRREIEPDPVFGNELCARFINKVMRDGKKQLAQRIFYQAMNLVGQRTGKHPLTVFEQALKNAMPMLETKSRRVGGASYQVPVEIRPERRVSLGMRWLVQYANQRPERTAVERLAAEIIDASNGTGGAVKKKEDTHRMAEANKAFAHYRW